MARKILFGLLWFVVIYIVACIVVGAIAGGLAGIGVENPQEAYAAGRVAGAKAVAPLRPYLLLGSAALCLAGAIKGFLPGTKSKQQTAPSDGV